MPAITLYGPRVAPYTEKVIRALRLKGLDFELVEPTSREDYRRWNPETGLLPMIEVDGTRVHDSAAILDLLDERFPDPPLVSRNPSVAAQQRSLEAWVDETFFYYLYRWLRERLGDAAKPDATDHESGEMGPLARLGMLGANGRPRAELFDTGDGGLGREFDHVVDDLVQMLGERPFFYADQPSRGDLAAFAVLWGLFVDRYSGGRTLLDARPSLLAFVERVDRATGGGG